MSATNRGLGGIRGAIRPRLVADSYATPAWVTKLLLREVDLPRGHWLDPCAGDGAIIRAANPKVDWSACEIRGECGPALSELNLSEILLGDFLDVGTRAGLAARAPYDVILTNPPYSLAEDFVNACLPLARNVIFLLRLNFLEGIRRSAFWQSHMPDVYVLSNRPSFTGKGTDATAYAWFRWYGAGIRREGAIRVLPLVPRDARKS